MKKKANKHIRIVETSIGEGMGDRREGKEGRKVEGEKEEKRAFHPSRRIIREMSMAHPEKARSTLWFS